MNSIEMPYQKITGIPFVGDKLTFNEMLANIILDEDMKGYTEMYDWMRRILDTNDVSAVKAASLGLPSSQADVTLSILNSANNVTRQIKYIDCVPTSLTDIQFEPAQGDSFLTFGVSFRFTYFELV
jgi:hypothetical protein